jgi:hypothetical protein
MASLLEIAHARWLRDLADETHPYWRQRADIVHHYLYAAEQVLAGEDRLTADRLRLELDQRIEAHAKAEMDKIVSGCHG